MVHQAFSVEGETANILGFASNIQSLSHSLLCFFRCIFVWLLLFYNAMQNIKTILSFWAVQINHGSPNGTLGVPSP